MADDTGRTFPHREMDRRDREEVHRVVVAATSTGEVALHTEDLKVVMVVVMVVVVECLLEESPHGSCHCP